ncbi:MAG: glycosyltransferase [Desulfobacteraceae bacterium]|nr:glycosyltransferase [Desulfobacteraceae bacterium]
MQTLNLVQVLISGQYEVTVCCYYEYDESVVEWFREAGARVILLGLDRSDGRFGIGRVFELMRRLLAVGRDVKPDIVHVQYVAPGLVPIIASRIAKIKTVFATVHQPGSPYGRKAKLLLRFGARLCTSFFCISKAVEESWFGDSKVFEPENVDRHRRHYTIYNAGDAIFTYKAVITRVDRRAFKESLGLDEHPIIIIVGRLRGEKGHSVLLDAVTTVATAFPDVRLLVIGDGPDRESLKLKAEVLGIASNIVWMGQKEPDEVFKLLAISDIAVVPSLFEGFGLVAAEAMTVGLPVIGSDVDGLREVIEHEVTGVLFPPGDSTALSETLIDFLKNPDKAKGMGAKGRERVRRLFSLERFAISTLSAYRGFS